MTEKKLLKRLETIAAQLFEEAAEEAAETTNNEDQVDSRLILAAMSVKSALFVLMGQDDEFLAVHSDIMGILMTEVDKAVCDSACEECVHAEECPSNQFQEDLDKKTLH